MNWFFLSLMLSCNKDKTASTDDSADLGFQPTVLCPGSEGCSNNDGPLSVGAASVSIVPDCYESWLDCGEDGLVIVDSRSSFAFSSPSPASF